MLYEESTKILEKINQSFISKFQSLVNNVSKIENKDDFKGHHYKLLFGNKIGMLNNELLEALGVPKPPKENKIKNYYDRCRNLISQITVCINEWKSFWKSNEEKIKSASYADSEAGSHSESGPVSRNDWPDFAKKATKDMYVSCQGDRLDWCNLYTTVLKRLSEPIKDLSSKLNKLK